MKRGVIVTDIPRKGRVQLPPAPDAEHPQAQPPSKRSAEQVTSNELGEVKEKIIEVLRVFNGRVFTAEELRVAIFPRYSMETIRDAMWELNDEGKAKLWVRLL